MCKNLNRSTLTLGYRGTVLNVEKYRIRKGGLNVSYGIRVETWGDYAQIGRAHV